jgi:hypothetical protein
MLIIEYMHYFRIDETRPFFIDENPYTPLETHIESGNVAQSQILSSDKLTKTIVTKYKTLDCFNQNINRAGIIAVKNKNFEFNKANSVPRKTPIESYKLLGFTDPFALTTTYTFPANSVYQSIFFGNVKNTLITDGRFELHDVQLLDNSQTVTLVETFKDSTEYNTVRFSDSYWIPQLHKMNVTKQVDYKLI